MSKNPDLKWLALLFIAIAPVSYAQDVSGLLPDSIGVLGRSDSARIYIGSELFNLIDGGAVIFNDYGFNKVVVQRYSDSSGGYVDVELYEMKDSSSAYGIYSMITFNTGERVKGFPGEAYSGDGFLLFRKGKYYAGLTASDASKGSGLATAAMEMAGRIPGSGRPPLVSKLERGLFRGFDDLKVAYIKGGLGFYNLSTISFGEHLKFVDGVCLSTSTVRSFVLAYDSEDSCRKDFSILVDHLRNDGHWDPVKSECDASLFRRQKEHLKCVCLDGHISVTVSEYGAVVEEMSQEIRAILTLD